MGAIFYSFQGPVHMGKFHIGLPNDHSQSKVPFDPGVGQKEVPALIQLPQQFLVKGISAFQRIQSGALPHKTAEIQKGFGEKEHVRVFAQLFTKIAAKPDVLSQLGLQTFDPESP
jgi:hypothetical protein